MAGRSDNFSDEGEARRHFSRHDEEDGADLDQPSDEEKSRSRSEGLDTLKSYLREIRRSTLLTFKQEQQLGKRVMAGDEQARQQMIESNLRLVISIGKRYIHRGFPFSDIVEEGNLGLIQAARKFDPDRGARFITYAIWWIRQAIMHALAEGQGAVRLPIKQAETLSKLRQKIEEFRQQTGVEPTVEELGAALHMKPEDVDDLLRVYRPQLSLDAPINEGTDSTQLDFIEANHLPSSEEVYLHASLINEVHELLEQLEHRESMILRARFGFDDPPKSLAAIGRELGLSRERVRQIETRARSKLKALAKDKALRHFFN